jgi:hypothetical protein
MRRFCRCCCCTHEPIPFPFAYFAVVFALDWPSLLRVHACSFSSARCLSGLCASSSFLLHRARVALCILLVGGVVVLVAGDCV